MNRANIEEKVREATVTQLGVDESEVVAGSHFWNDLGADSLDVVELTMALEEEFGVEISDEEAENAATFKQACDLVERKLSEKKR